tara:strand:+ start:47 stop:322 length:276 start_codon:yes stop_codon:yes gene_type:complete
MKYILTITILMTMTSVINANEKKPNCESTLSALKPSCNILGSGLNKLKEFSSKHKTVGQTMGIKSREKKTLKQITEENKTINQTLRNLKKK